MGQEALCSRKAQVDLGFISGTITCMTLGKLQNFSEPKIVSSHVKLDFVIYLAELWLNGVMYIE